MQDLANLVLNYLLAKSKVYVSLHCCCILGWLREEYFLKILLFNSTALMEIGKITLCLLSKRNFDHNGDDKSVMRSITTKCLIVQMYDMFLYSVTYVSVASLLVLLLCYFCYCYFTTSVTLLLRCFNHAISFYILFLSIMLFRYIYIYIYYSCQSCSPVIYIIPVNYAIQYIY